jgi:hypothetical protein
LPWYGALSINAQPIVITVQDGRRLRQSSGGQPEIQGVTANYSSRISSYL